MPYRGGAPSFWGETPDGAPQPRGRMAWRVGYPGPSKKFIQLLQLLTTMRIHTPFKQVIRTIEGGGGDDGYGTPTIPV